MQNGYSISRLSEVKECKGWRRGRRGGGGGGNLFALPSLQGRRIRERELGRKKKDRERHTDRGGEIIRRIGHLGSKET